MNRRLSARNEDGHATFPSQFANNDRDGDSITALRCINIVSIFPADRRFLLIALVARKKFAGVIRSAIVRKLVTCKDECA